MNKVTTILSFLILFPVIDLIGCSCGQVLSTEEEYNHQRVVAAGKIISKELISRIDSVQFNKFLADGKIFDEMDKRFIYYHYLKLRLIVKKSFKGNITKDTIDIYTAIGSASCGIDFKVDQNYIIYGRSSTYLPSSIFPNREYPNGENIIWTNLCSRTRLSNKRELDKLTKLSRK